MKVIGGFAPVKRRDRTSRIAPGSVELFDDNGELVGVVWLAHNRRVVGAGAETVYLHREAQPERLRQSA